MNVRYLINKNKIFLVVLFFIFVLHVLTYPSIHNISDEQLYLDISKKVCKLDFSDFSGKAENAVHPILYYGILCLTSPLHNFDLQTAQLVTFGFLIALVIGWYLITEDFSQTVRKRFVLLLFANSLLWVYSFRVLIDVPLAFFLSLGAMSLYLFFESGRKKNYYIGAILLSFALLTKESAVLIFPIFLVYLLIRRKLNIKNFILLGIPVIPYAIFRFFTGAQGSQSFFRSIRFLSSYDYSFVPYSYFPTILFMLGIFGLGIVAVVWMWKNYRKMEIKNFLLFTLILYIIWEIFYDAISVVNWPRYHTALIPFLSLIIAEASTKNKNMKYIYLITLIYSILTGFAAAYYFHVNIMEIWKIIPKIF